MRRSRLFFSLLPIARYALAVVFALALASLPFARVAGARNSAPASHAPAATTRPHIFPVHTGGQPIRPSSRSSGADQMLYHGGPVMKTSSITYAIFWEPAQLQAGDSAYVSPTYNSLIQRYFNDIGGSGLYANNTQYYDTTGHIVASSTFGGAWVDTSAYPTSGCTDVATPSNCLTDAQIQAEVQKALVANSWIGGLTHMFYVFTARGEGSCFDSYSLSCAFTQYCGYHSYTGGSGAAIIYANMPYTGTLLAGCGVPSTANNDEDADSTISVISHEQMEAVTDPQLNAWFDTSGSEIGDKCSWNFGNVSLENGNANVQWNSNFYIVQQEWSNAISGCALSAPQTPPQIHTMLFVGSQDGSLYALNAADGTKLWSVKTGGAKVTSPVATKTIVYAGSSDGSIYALKTSDGTVVWHKKTGGSIVAAPALSGNVLYLGSGDGYLYAFNAAKGTELWRYRLGSPITTTPAVAGTTIFTTATNGTLYAINASKGKLLWFERVAKTALSAPIMANNTLYLSTANGLLFSVNIKSGKINWSYSINHSAFTTPVIANNVVYVGSSSGAFIALDATRGKKRWSYTAQGGVAAPASVSNGVIFFGARNGLLYALNAANGSAIWRYAAQAAVSSSPAISAGTVYVGSDDHNVYALSALTGVPSWQFATGGKVESSPFVLQLS